MTSAAVGPRQDCRNAIISRRPQTPPIIEFKRPMRKSYATDESPIAQVYGYIRDIRAGKKTTCTGRPIRVEKTTPFFCYIVCDISEQLDRWADDAGFRKTPDGQGYYNFNENHNSFTEIIPFDKMLSDAKKRQLAFFQTLNLPSHSPPQ